MPLLTSIPAPSVPALSSTPTSAHAAGLTARKRATPATNLFICLLLQEMRPVRQSAGAADRRAVLQMSAFADTDRQSIAFLVQKASWPDHPVRPFMSSITCRIAAESQR